MPFCAALVESRLKSLSINGLASGSLAGKVLSCSAFAGMELPAAMPVAPYWNATWPPAKRSESIPAASWRWPQRSDYDIQFVGGFKNTLFGGEGLFLATLKGPGHIWLQSMPFSRLAGRVISASSALSGKGEGSVLDGIGIGQILRGD